MPHSEHLYENSDVDYSVHDEYENNFKSPTYMHYYLFSLVSLSVYKKTIFRKYLLLNGHLSCG
jgi:hypothetical protein